jgi:hypothetical protein
VAAVAVAVSVVAAKHLPAVHIQLLLALVLMEVTLVAQEAVLAVTVLL